VSAAVGLGFQLASLFAVTRIAVARGATRVGLDTAITLEHVTVLGGLRRTTIPVRALRYQPFLMATHSISGVAGWGRWVQLPAAPAAPHHHPGDKHRAPRAEMLLHQLCDTVFPCRGS
jgi:hypothetical protein